MSHWNGRPKKCSIKRIKKSYDPNSIRENIEKTNNVSFSYYSDIESQNNNKHEQLYGKLYIGDPQLKSKSKSKSNWKNEKENRKDKENQNLKKKLNNNHNGRDKESNIKNKKDPSVTSSTLNCPTKEPKEKNKWEWIPKLKTKKICTNKIYTNQLKVIKSPIIAQQGIQLQDNAELSSSSSSNMISSVFPSFGPTSILQSFATTIIPYTLIAQGPSIITINPTSINAIFIGFNRIFDVFLVPSLSNTEGLSAISINLLEGNNQIIASPTPVDLLQTQTFIPLRPNATLVNRFTSPDKVSIRAKFSAFPSPGTILIDLNSTATSMFEIGFNFAYVKF